jgi:hypothetical protein
LRLDFAVSSEARSSGLPAPRLVNMYPEVTKAGPGKSARLPRPGLQSVYSLGVSGIRGVYRQDGVFGGAGFAVCGTKLFMGEVELGDVALGSYARFAASPSQLVVVVGGSAYCYDGATLAQITMPDGKRVSDVGLVGDRFYYLIENDDEWYFSAIDDATDVDGLAFATADSQPDASVGITVLNDRVIFHGRTSTEFWQQTGDPDAPLVRSQGSTYTRGCISARSIVRADNRVFWVGDDLKVYTLGAPNRVSDHALEEQLRLCTDPGNISAWAASWDGHDFVAFNLPGRGTWALHVESGQWAEWTSHGRETFRAACAVMVEGTAYLGDSVTGTIFRFAEVYTDDGDPIERIASCVGPAGVYGEIELEAAMGVGLVGNVIPQVELRYSDDRGQTWTAWKSRSLGLIGRYDHRARWHRLGKAKRQRNFEIRCTDPIKAVFVNVEARVG